MIKITKLGKQINNSNDKKSTNKHFNCPSCGCSYIASYMEYGYCSKVYPYYYCKCPNCHTENWVNK